MESIVWTFEGALGETLGLVDSIYTKICRSRHSFQFLTMKAPVGRFWRISVPYRATIWSCLGALWERSGLFGTISLVVGLANKLAWILGPKTLPGSQNSPTTQR